MDKTDWLIIAIVIVLIVMCIGCADTSTKVRVEQEVSIEQEMKIDDYIECTYQVVSYLWIRNDNNLKYTSDIAESISTHGLSYEEAIIE